MLRACLPPPPSGAQVTLHNLRLTNGGGDGIYVLAARGSRFSCITSDHNYRQGMSIIGAQGLVVSDSVFAFTRGTARPDAAPLSCGALF